MSRIGSVRWWGVAFVLGLTSACAQPEFGYLEVEQRSSSPLPVDVDDNGVTLPLGVALRLKVKPVSDNRQPYTANDDLEFKSDNSSVMGAYQLEKTSQVVITGARVGKTCLRVLVNKHEVDCLAVRVVEQ